MTTAEREIWMEIVKIRAKLGDTRWKAITYANRIIEASKSVEAHGSFWLEIVEIRAALGESHEKAVAYANRIVEVYREKR